MQSSRWIALGLATLGITSLAGAQIDGPTPLAWRWSASTAVAPSGTPTIDGDNVYVGVGGRVFCVDKATGNKKWQYPLIEPIDGYFKSSPIVAGGLVIAAATNKTIYAIDPAKGEKVWSYEAPGGVLGNPVLAGKYVVFNLDGKELMAVDATDGKPAWENPERIFDGMMGGLASYNTDVFFFTRTRQLWVLKTTTKRANRLATFQNLSSDSVPLISGDQLYVASGNYVVSVNPISGAARWQSAVPQSLIYGPAVMVDGVAVGTAEGSLIILDSTGQIKSRRVGEGATAKRERMIVELGSRPIASPAAVGKLFAVPTANGALNLVDPEKGEVVWSFLIQPLTAGLKASNTNQANNSQSVERAGLIVSVPAAGPAVLSGKTMFLLASDGSLLAFDKDQGIDLTGPAVQLVWPNQGAQVGTRKGPLDVFFRISDEATGVAEKSLKITVNEKPIDFTYGRDGFATMRFGQGLKNGILQDGRATFTVTVSDWMGNQTMSSFTLMIDNDLAPIALPGGTRPDAGGGRQGGGGAATGG
jgi:outer membrane protein assembly factor BamB